ncbi:MAG: ribulose-phosphate 3-epimerase [Flavobacteriales bacterium TMED288]|nr:ribulose-phosphate 3-epimerase [Flavobacteriales bacterium]RPG52766.1 MAG: ribulose-phosphate 3-epimerase [Flavobacteriales bacterium TMED288]
MSHLIAPSLLSCDLSDIKSEILMLNKSKADWYHIDVMDGYFVPNITFGFPIIKSIKKYSKKPLDVHLMITNPSKYILDFKNAGADILTIHYEVENHLDRTVNKIKSNGMKAGVAINPHTPISYLENIINMIDIVCLMSVNPGFGGQKFIINTYKKITQLKNLILNNSSKTLIEIDGGVTLENKNKLLNLGADILVAGNTIFSNPDPNEIISKLKFN